MMLNLLVKQRVVLANQSVTPVLLKNKRAFESLELFSLIASDVLAGSPNFEVLQMDQDY
jgi:hypothetical protein